MSSSKDCLLKEVKFATMLLVDGQDETNDSIPPL